MLAAFDAGHALQFTAATRSLRAGAAEQEVADYLTPILTAAAGGECLLH